MHKRITGWRVVGDAPTFVTILWPRMGIIGVDGSDLQPMETILVTELMRDNVLRTLANGTGVGCCKLGYHVNSCVPWMPVMTLDGIGIWHTSEGY